MSGGVTIVIASHILGQWLPHLLCNSLERCPCVSTVNSVNVDYVI